ncbi:MAG: hypothetical protein NC205_04660 [Prevotella sp.]|nr:hypothetical protein [Alistipes senegalensis]MCM1357865.1 hypothetical protein [Prevotella sp.]MCM1473006.1 hypothetical protein [Muribaculaceae bacterium]
MIKFTADFMKISLDGFGGNYKYPVYASVCCRSGFFSRYRAKSGFVAVSDNGKLFVSEYSVLGTERKYIFSVSDLKSLKIKKLPLMPIYNIKAVFKIERKNIKLDMAVSLKIAGGDFPEQAENAVNLIGTLNNWIN